MFPFAPDKKPMGKSMPKGKTPAKTKAPAKPAAKSSKPKAARGC
jgi:hypothetical protein